MTGIAARSGFKSVTLEGVVIRCGCSPEDKARPDFHGHTNTRCPNPRAIEDKGVLARWDANGAKPPGAVRTIVNHIKHIFGA